MWKKRPRVLSLARVLPLCFAHGLSDDSDGGVQAVPSAHHVAGGKRGDCQGRHRRLYKGLGTTVTALQCWAPRRWPRTTSSRPGA